MIGGVPENYYDSFPCRGEYKIRPFRGLLNMLRGVYFPGALNQLQLKYIMTMIGNVFERTRPFKYPGYITAVEEGFRVLYG